MIIAGIGEILWDIYEDGRFLGGAIANCIHTVKMLGHEGIIISRVGNDPEGREIIHLLSERGYSVDYLQVDEEHKTGFVRVKLDENNEPSFTCNKSAAYDYLEWEQWWLEKIPGFDAILFGTFAQRTVESAAATQRFIRACSNSLRVFDVNIRSWNETTRKNIRDCLQMTNILKMNEDELNKFTGLFPGITGSTVQRLHTLVYQTGIDLACLTVGTWGCLLADGNTVEYIPGLAVDSVDTTGAGDAFIAALIVKYLQGNSPAQSAAFANYVAAYITACKGATPHYSIDSVKEMTGKIRKYNIKAEWKELMTDRNISW